MDSSSSSLVVVGEEQKGLGLLMHAKNVIAPLTSKKHEKNIFGHKTFVIG